MDEGIWDIADRVPVELPELRGDSQLAYEVAVAAMTFGARRRYLRAMATIDVVRALLELGVGGIRKTTPQAPAGGP